MLKTKLWVKIWSLTWTTWCGKKLRKLKIQKQSEYNIIKNISDLFKLKKNNNQAIKDRIIRGIKTLFEQQEGNYYKLLIVGNFWSNYYIEYEISGDRDKTRSVKKDIKEVKPYLRDIIVDPKSDMWEIQLTISYNIIYSKHVDEDRVMHSRIMTYDNRNEVNEELFKLLLSGYQYSLETSIRGSDFIFDSVER